MLDMLDAVPNVGGRAKEVYADVSHTKLPGPGQRTMLDESHSSFSHERRQLPNQATRWDPTGYNVRR